MRTSEGGGGVPRSCAAGLQASRAKKAVQSNVKAIENRIRYFQREEAKIWRDLEEVRRQAGPVPLAAQEAGGLVASLVLCV